MPFKSTREDLLLNQYRFFHFEKLAHSCYLYAQCNTDYLSTFIFHVTSAHDKFPIPLHWLYIYDACMEFASYSIITNPLTFFCITLSLHEDFRILTLCFCNGKLLLDKLIIWILSHCCMVSHLHYVSASVSSHHHLATPIQKSAFQQYSQMYSVAIGAIPLAKPIKSKNLSWKIIYSISPFFWIKCSKL